MTLREFLEAHGIGPDSLLDAELDERTPQGMVVTASLGAVGVDDVGAIEIEAHVPLWGST